MLDGYTEELPTTQIPAVDPVPGSLRLAGLQVSANDPEQLAVWQSSSGEILSATNNTRVGWGPVLKVAEASSKPTQLSVAGGGSQGVAAWVVDDAGVPRVQYAIFNAYEGGAKSDYWDPEVWASPAGSAASNPTTSVANDGSGIVIGWESSDSVHVFNEGLEEPQLQTFPAPGLVPGSSSVQATESGIGAAWAVEANGRSTIYATAVVDRNLPAPVVVAQSQPSSKITELAYNLGDTATVASASWTETSGSSSSIYASAWGAKGWAPKKLISAGGESDKSSSPSTLSLLDYTPVNGALFAWLSAGTVMTATVDILGQWSQAKAISSPGVASQLYADFPDGIAQTQMVWNETSAQGNQVMRSLVKELTCGPPQAVSGYQSTPTNPVAGWAVMTAWESDTPPNTTFTAVRQQ